MNLLEALNWAKELLVANGVEGPEGSSEFLLSRLLDKNKAYLISHADEEISDQQVLKYKEWIQRRSKHEPVWYITGSIEFLGLDFAVNRDVLIPRPETELMIEKITEYSRDGFSPKSLLDIGTGSGAIIISLANILGSHTSKDCDAKFFASDISEKALAVAKQNAKTLGFEGIIEFRLGGLFEPWTGQNFDLIVTNLPYVPENDKDTLAPDLTDHEPHLALFGGADGLEIIREFIAELPKHLNPGGKVFMEIGYDQGNTIKEIVADILPKADIKVLTDYDDTDRIVIIEAEPRTF